MDQAHPKKSPSVKQVKTSLQATVANTSGGLPPMAGGQESEPVFCQPTFHQEICVEGEVTTTVKASCETKVFCLEGGVGEGCPSNGFPPPTECKFKFFQNLCVEVDVTIEADAECDITRVVCGDAEEGPCLVPPPPV